MRSFMSRLLLLATLASLSACQPKQTDLSIPFVAEFNGQGIQCGADLPLALTDLRFFVHDVELHDASGEGIATRIVRDAAWQNGQVAMIDLESGTDACDDGTPAINDVLRLSVAGGVAVEEIHGLAFTLGVPFELNHDNPLKAAPPLDDSAESLAHFRGLLENTTQLQ